MHIQRFKKRVVIKRVTAGFDKTGKAFASGFDFFLIAEGEGIVGKPQHFHFGSEYRFIINAFLVAQGGNAGARLAALPPDLRGSRKTKFGHGGNVEINHVQPQARSGAIGAGPLRT